MTAHKFYCSNYNKNIHYNNKFKKKKSQIYSGTNCIICSLGDFIAPPKEKKILFPLSLW